MLKGICVSLLFVVVLLSCSRKNIVDYQSNNLSIDSTFENNLLDSIIIPYRNSMKSVMTEVIGFSDSSFIKYAPESPLGNLVADIVFNAGIGFMSAESETKFQIHKVISLINFGGLRAPINSGEVTVGNMYELMPFDNSIVIMELTPDKVKEMLDYMFLANGQPISNGKMKLSDKKKELFINNAEYLFDLNIYVVTSNYLADGGDKMDFFKNSVNRWDSGILIRDALIEYVKKVEKIPYRSVNERIVIQR